MFSQHCQSGQFRACVLCFAQISLYDISILDIKQVIHDTCMFLFSFCSLVWLKQKWRTNNQNQAIKFVWSCFWKITISFLLLLLFLFHGGNNLPYKLIFSPKQRAKKRVYQGLCYPTVKKRLIQNHGQHPKMLSTTHGATVCPCPHAHHDLINEWELECKCPILVY